MKHIAITIILLIGLNVLTCSQVDKTAPIDKVLSDQKARWEALSQETKNAWYSAKRKAFRNSWNANWAAYSKSGKRYLNDYEVQCLLGEFTDVRIDYPSDVSVFRLDRLAYPQYASYYELDPDEWAELQDYCRERLKDSLYAADAVTSHWRSIAAGIPPFGLKVRR